MGISQLVSGLYYVTRVTGCNIHIGAKLYSLGRASVATNFGIKTISYNGNCRVTNVLFLTSENDILGLIYSLFRGRQNIS